MSLLRDLGYEKKPVLAIDAKATEHILHRQGVGKLKHIDVAYLWIRDEVRSQRLRVRRVRSEDNVADMGTKPLSKAIIAKHCLRMGYVNMNQENVLTIKPWRYSGTLVQQSAHSSQVTMSREQPAGSRSNRSTRSSGSKQVRSLGLGSRRTQATRQARSSLKLKPESATPQVQEEESRAVTVPLGRRYALSQSGNYIRKEASGIHDKIFTENHGFR